ncbi:MAG: butyrate kinase [Lentisphaerae bacterium]|jgi:butyrate kinase|nr:butyrate kinase [Lentisphaerota bacterium]
MKDGKYRVLVINPGSTSTKVSLFEDETQAFEWKLFHDSSVLLKFAHINDQMPFRRGVILDMLKSEGIDPETIDAFAGRCGGTHSQPSGIIRVDKSMYEDAAKGLDGSEHPAKLGVMLAWKFAEEYGKSAFTLNSTNVDEFNDFARLTGIKGVYRFSHSHCLNQKAVAEFHAEKIGHRYEDCNFIVAHIDGGITVGAHERGRLVDSNMGADGEGAFSPTRIGSIPVLQVLNYLETHSADELRRRCTRSGGFVDFFGTSNSDTIHELVEKGDRKATLVWNTMIYQICKLIGEMATVLRGKVDGILLTGGLLRFADIVEGIEDRCGFIAPVSVYPGEMEQEALALPTLRVLRGESAAHAYSGRDVWQGFEGTDL